MFVSNFTNERYVEPIGGGFIDDDSNDDNIEKKEQMDEDEDNVEDIQFVFPDPQSSYQMNQNGQILSDPNMLPVTFKTPDPKILQGLNEIPDLLLNIKRTLSAQYCLPIVIHTSPFIPFLTKKWTERFVNWLDSACRLRLLMEAVKEMLIPLHESITKEWIMECFQNFLKQMKMYEHSHEERIGAISGENALKQFQEELEAYSYYYIHSIEHFLFKTMIEPHVETSLSFFLTPYSPSNMTPDACERKEECQKCIGDFFAFKSELLGCNVVIPWDNLQIYWDEMSKKVENE